MSRGKLMHITEAEWQRLNEAARKLRTLNESLPQLIDDVRRTTQQDFERGFETVAERQKAFEDQLESAGVRVSQMEKDTNRRLRDHARRIAEQEIQLVARIDAETDRMRQETGELVRAEHEWTRALLTTEHEQRVRETHRLQEEIDSLYLVKERAARMTQEMLLRAELTVRHIVGEPALSRLAAGRVEKLEQRLALSRANLEAGLAEAALPVAQESWLQLSELRMEVEAADLEWRILRNRATRLLRLLADAVDRNRFRNGVDLDGRENESEVFVDRWSNGGLTRLEGHIAAQQRRLGDELSPPSTDELRQLLDEHIPRLHTALQDISQLAGAEQLASQLRADLANAAADVLATSGYQLRSWAYQGSDERGPVSAKLVHPDQSEIVILVSQLPGDEPDCILELTTHNEGIGDDDVRRARARDVVASLREANIRVRDPEETGEPEPGRTDIESFQAQTFVPPARKHSRIEFT
ncbi:hypothetical protein ACFZAD_21085 [Streptomyces iakyrus]|uniref:hypothetical protein n=1 Tax=Streptomyces iakyrus TaxID=68219 RepID=UPI0036ED4DFF